MELETFEKFYECLFIAKLEMIIKLNICFDKGIKLLKFFIHIFRFVNYLGLERKQQNLN